MGKSKTRKKTEGGKTEGGRSETKKKPSGNVSFGRAHIGGAQLMVIVACRLRSEVFCCAGAGPGRVPGRVVVGVDVFCCVIGWIVGVVCHVFVRCPSGVCFGLGFVVAAGCRFVSWLVK